MSTEFQAGFPCPHMMMEEPVALSDDRRSLYPKSPISSAASVRVLLNDSIYVPSGGFLSRATLQSSSSGPYRILPCTQLNGPDANLLTIETQEGTSSVRLPIGERVRVDEVIRAIRLSEAYSLVEPSSLREALAFTEKNALGPSSYVRLSGGAVDSLGFDQKGSRGNQVYPGWELVNRKSVYPSLIPGLTTAPSRYIRFKTPVRGNPTIKVTYAAMPERCVRCGATYIENDYRFDLAGDAVTIRNEDLLYQACLKAVLTVKGSNPYHTGYGSEITKRVGLKLTGESAMLIRQDVQNALRQVQNLQSGQRKYQSVTNREFLYSIENVDVRPSAEDPTVFFVDVTIRNAANRPVNLTTVFSVPGTIALAGTNGQALGLETSGLSRSQSSRFLRE